MTDRTREGEHGLVFSSTSCGCAIVGAGVCGDPLRIDFCQKHAAVDDLAGAVRLLVVALGKRRPPVKPFRSDGGQRGYTIEDTGDEMLAFTTAVSAMRKAGLDSPLDERAKR